MITRSTLNKSDRPTPEQIREIWKAAKHPIVPDDDCPFLTAEECAASIIAAKEYSSGSKMKGAFSKQGAADCNSNTQGALVPVNQDFLDVFKIFMNPEQTAKIRANHVRQYFEGIIDLLLKDKITPHLPGNKPYEKLSWVKKREILERYYDKDIAEKLHFGMSIGDDGSHFNGNVSQEDLKKIIDLATHIIEDIFVKYFLDPAHLFGREASLMTIFSMLPLDNRIYILENVYLKEQNVDVINKLALAYAKNNQMQKAQDLLKNALQRGEIDDDFYHAQLYSLDVLTACLPELYKRNNGYFSDSGYTEGIVADNLPNGTSVMVVGFPTNKTIFDTARATKIFKKWFDAEKNRYPEFINLFLCLMSRDTRSYQ